MPACAGMMGPAKLTKFAPRRGRCRVGLEGRVQSWRLRIMSEEANPFGTCRKIVGLLLGEPRVRRSPSPKILPGTGRGDHAQHGGGGSPLALRPACCPLHRCAVPLPGPGRISGRRSKKTLTQPSPACGRGLKGLGTGLRRRLCARGRGGS